MDINTLRIGIMLASFTAFIGIVAWAYRPARKQALDEVARAILEDAAGENAP